LINEVDLAFETKKYENDYGDFKIDEFNNKYFPKALVNHPMFSDKKKPYVFESRQLQGRLLFERGSSITPRLMLAGGVLNLVV
jgi:hypothetical protein